MRVYRVTFLGERSTGTMYVVEDTARKAYRRSVEELKNRGVWEENEDTFSEDDLEVIALGKPGVYSYEEEQE